MEFEELIYVLEKSVEKNGEKPLTNKWLLNILKQVERNIEQDDFHAEIQGSSGDIY